MFEVTLLKEIFTVVIHPAGGFVDPRAVGERFFVCGSLMDPAFTAGVIGRAPAMCPAVAEGFARGWGEHDGAKMHFLTRSPGARTQGMALLGLTEAEVAKLEAFEGVPEVREKVAAMLTIGDIALEGATFIKHG